MQTYLRTWFAGQTHEVVVVVVEVGAGRGGWGGRGRDGGVLSDILLVAGLAAGEVVPLPLLHDRVGRRLRLPFSFLAVILLWVLAERRCVVAVVANENLVCVDNATGCCGCRDAADVVECVDGVSPRTGRSALGSAVV